MVWLNPFVRLGDASSPTNLNRVIHGPWEAWPWQGYALAAHVLRLFSTLLGLGTMLLIFAAGRLLWPAEPRPALLAVSLLALLPQFIFLHGSVTNDAMVIFWATATLYLLVRVWVRGSTPLLVGLAGAAAGLALLSKMAGLLLIPYGMGFLLVAAWQRGGRKPAALLRPALRDALLYGAVAALVGGWLLLRNWQLYGDMTAASQFARLEGTRSVGAGTVFGELPGIWYSTVAVLGWFNVRAAPWVYWLWGAIMLAAAAGLVAAARARRDWLLPALLGGWVLLVAAGLLSFMLTTPAAQGRLLFPALLPLALGLGRGASRWPAPAAALALGGAAAAALLVPLQTLPRAYARPASYAPADIPPSALRLDRPLGYGLTLLAAEVDPAPRRAGEYAQVTLYWAADAQRPTGREQAPELVIELFGRDEALVGKLQTYHGGGLYPASLWPAGAMIVETVGVPTFAQGGSRQVPVLPVAARVQVRLVDGSGVVDVGRSKLVPDAWPAARPLLATIAPGTGVVAAAAPAAAQAGETVRIDVIWQITDPPGADLTTFVHLGPAGAPPLASGDAPPLQGAYPTLFWAAGEQFDDRYMLALPADLPPGQYPIWIGMYDGSGRRALTVDGVRQPNDALLVGVITVGAP